MKRLILFALLALVCARGTPVHAQVSNQLTGSGAPSGSCTSTQQYLDTTGHVLYYCNNNAWSASQGLGNLTGGGGSAFGTPQPQFTVPFYSAAGTGSALGQICSPPTTNGTYGLLYSVTATAAVQPSCPQVGLAGRAITGAATTDIVAYSDNNTVVDHDQAASGAVNQTLPTATTLGNPNFGYVYCNHSAQSDTITPTTWTIQVGSAAAGATATVTAGACIRIKPDPNSVTNWLGDSGGGALSGTGAASALAFWTSTSNLSNDTNLTHVASQAGLVSGTGPGISFGAGNGTISIKDNSTIDLGMQSNNAGVEIKGANLIGTNDEAVHVVVNGSSAWGVIDSLNGLGGGSSLGMAVATNTATPVAIWPNKVHTVSFLALSGGGMQMFGSSPACTFTSGGGTSPSCTTDTGSNNQGGIIIATTGTGAPALTGTITLTFTAAMGTNKPSCTYTLSENGAGQWGSLATVMDKTPSTLNDLFQWTNATGATPAGVALSTSTAYWINYQCLAK